MNSKGTKYRWMTVLMVSSQILLAGFVSYWLLSQYRIEKHLFQSRMQDVYLQTHEQLIDTLVLKHLVLPSLEDSLMVQINISDNHDAFVLHDTMETNIIAYRINGQEHPDSSGQQLLHRQENPDRDMLVRSVKLFIDHTDETFRSNAAAHVFAMDIDTLHFLNQFRTALDEYGTRLSVKWENEKSTQFEKKGSHGLMIRIENLSELPAIRIENYRGLLLGLMLPQILFALILLGISTSALIIAYRSLGKQLMLNRLRDDFIANISHELKTPVSTVKIALEALGNYNPKNDPEVTREYLAMAQSETERLEKLVERVLNHEALLGPLAKESLESCDLGVLTQMVVNSMKIAILEKGAVVKVEEMASPILVEADKLYLEGMIMNLLDNSLKYSGSKPQIVIQISTGPSGPTLSVRDNGPGIPDEYNKLVFDKFFRVPSGHRHNVKGYGLGLSFASRVMKQLGGAVTFKNLPGEGCEFTLHFPYKRRV